MTRTQHTDEEISLRVMAYLDGELPPDDAEEVGHKIDTDPRYREAHRSLSEIKEATNDMKLKNLPEMYWDEYWKHVYNRIERGLGWIFISVGAIILLSYGVWEFLMTMINNKSIHLILKAGIFILVIGFVILIVSILREKFMIRKVDKYREIER